MDRERLRRTADVPNRTKLVFSNLFNVHFTSCLLCFFSVYLLFFWCDVKLCRFTCFCLFVYFFHMWIIKVMKIYECLNVWKSCPYVLLTRKVLLVPKIKCKLGGGRLFAVLAPMLRNKLPPAIREPTLLEDLKPICYSTTVPKYLPSWLYYVFNSCLTLVLS